MIKGRNYDGYIGDKGGGAGAVLLAVKDKKLREILRKGGRSGARRDFFELLRRAVKGKY